MANKHGGRCGVSLLEIQLRVTLDAEGAGQELGHPVDHGVAFFILGLVQAQLARAFGCRHCRVELAAATGISPGLLGAMAGFAPALQRAVSEVQETGQAWVDDAGVAELVALLWPVRVEPQAGGRYLIRKNGLAN